VKSIYHKFASNSVPSPRTACPSPSHVILIQINKATQKPSQSHPSSQCNHNPHHTHRSRHRRRPHPRHPRRPRPILTPCSSRRAQNRILRTIQRGLLATQRLLGSGRHGREPRLGRQRVAPLAGAQIGLDGGGGGAVDGVERRGELWGVGPGGLDGDEGGGEERELGAGYAGRGGVEFGEDGGAVGRAEGVS
jgi:hypothetical protein